MELISILLILFTIGCVLFLQKSKNYIIAKTLNWIPAILFAYIIPAIITHAFNLDLSSVKLHTWSKTFIMPLAIILVMSALSIKQLKAVGIKPILVFLSGSAAVALSPFVLLFVFDLFGDGLRTQLLDNEYWKGLVTIVGSWIGGSTSQLILKEISGCNEQIFLVILVMDNVLVNIWTIFMFQKIKRSESINRVLGIKDQFQDFIPDQINLAQTKTWSNVLTIAICVAFVIIISVTVPSFLLKIIILSIAGLILGNMISFWNHGLVIKLGGIVIIMIMSILGLKLNFENFSLPLSIVSFSIIWLISHYVVMMIVAYLLKLNMAWVPIASMANVGGISTAPAVTQAYNEEWMPHAILLAILSMVSGTYWGMLSIYLFKMIS